MCEAKMYYILRELGTLEGMKEFYSQVAGIGGKKVIEAIEQRADELLRMYDDEAREIIASKGLTAPTPSLTADN